MKIQSAWVVLLGVVSLAVSAEAASSRPVIMLTGYWSPTNEMVRRFSKNTEQNPKGWIGSNWEGSGFDIQSYFPEFPEGSGSVGVGDFEVDWEPTKTSFDKITSEIHPIAIVSFGLGEGPWEIEKNAPDYRDHGPKLRNSLPAMKIAFRVNRSGKIGAWVDRNGDAGNYLCGYLSHLGAAYHEAHSGRGDPYPNLAQGFIHVAGGYSTEVYDDALKQTLRVLIEDLKKKLPRTRKEKSSVWPE